MKNIETECLFSLDEFTRFYFQQAKGAQEEFQDRNSNLPPQAISDAIEMTFAITWDEFRKGTLVDIDLYVREQLEHFTQQYYYDTYGIKR